MAVIAEPPAEIELAAAHESMLRALGVVRQAQLTLVAGNVKRTGNIREQEKFILTISEIRGMAARKAPQVELQRAVDTRILNHADYEKFKLGVAGSPDPFDVK